ncbi:unnamed protein product [Clonostachys rosea]|uniref:Uncharacterized protein n=1 Tax=Bionectria ochroleuca TaxID=29856 RepID=A0ABY6U169_BIOOC|nr:unnamed protein product [Clonostachys rosea]
MSPKMKSPQSPKTKAEGAGQDGLDDYKTLENQFYEALLLLNAMKCMQNECGKPHESQTLEKERLRKFLRGLAYFCDFKKGGDTYTSIGLEETESAFTFWVASNKHRPELADFLRDLLGRLKGLKDAPEAIKGDLRRNLQEMCFTKAAKRILQYKSHLSKSVEQAQLILAKPKTQNDEILSLWMSGLIKADSKDNLELCDSIFAASKQVHMLRLLRSRAKLERSLQRIRDKRNAFDEVRHYIGRLASHTRTHNQLCDVVEDQLIGEIIHAPVVCQIVPENATTEFTYDSESRLERLLVGIKDDAERRQVKSRLGHLEKKPWEIYKRIPEQYSNFKPRVHAEVQILEHFYKNNLKFAKNDKYVGGSKPSCECCYLYFKYHPARMVLPESSHKVFIHWGLPPVANRDEGYSEFVQQREILSNMVNALIRDTISETLDCRIAPCFRPDSSTELSTTIMSFRSMEPDGV